jgi:hypothetical protein
MKIDSVPQVMERALCGLRDVERTTRADGPVFAFRCRGHAAKNEMALSDDLYCLQEKEYGHLPRIQREGRLLSVPQIMR